MRWLAATAVLAALLVLLRASGTIDWPWSLVIAILLLAAAAVLVVLALMIGVAVGYGAASADVIERSRDDSGRRLRG